MVRLVTRGLALLVVVLTLSACKVELYSGLSQRDANEMMAVLLRGGVGAEKLPGKDNTVILMVEESQQERAIELLMARGLPRVKTANIGEIFNKDGLISSPTEERARFIHAMSEELSRTLSELDGVISVRVHVVLPDKRNPNSREPLMPASAAIFIKHQEEYDFTSYIPQVKRLVVNAIEGLQYDKVSVVLFPSAAVELPPLEAKKGKGFLGAFLENERRVLAVLGVMLVLILCLTGAVVYLAIIVRRSGPVDAAAPQPADAD